MGSHRNEPERRETEQPKHLVTVSEFFMGKTPVTQEQWKFVAQLPQVDLQLDLNPSNFSGNQSACGECVLA